MKKTKQIEKITFEQISSEISDDIFDMFNLNVNKEQLQKYFIKVLEKEKIVYSKLKCVQKQNYEKAVSFRDKELTILKDIKLIKNDIKNGKLE